jgi:hypothetical protein
MGGGLWAKQQESEREIVGAAQMASHTYAQIGWSPPSAAAIAGREQLEHCNRSNSISHW